MNEVKILFEGYARKTPEGWDANSTCVLVKSKGRNIIVDPGCNREKLLDALEREHLTLDDIDYVVLTHGHDDHALLADIFRNAEVITEGNSVPGTDVELLSTPGHTRSHISVAVRTPEGTYVIAGDVFWWTDEEEQKVDINKKDNVPVFDMEKLVESRKKILEMADYVIPGHGKIFRVEK